MSTWLRKAATSIAVRVSAQAGPLRMRQPGQRQIGLSGRLSHLE